MLQTAIDAAKAGGKHALSYFNNLPEVKKKADESPVTMADIETEQLIRRLISKKYPDHGFIGEEFGSTNPKAKFQWVIDPIDGTRSYIRNIPQWCILISVLEDNKPIVGVCYFPNQDELFSAEKGKGTFFNGKKTTVSKVENLNEAYISYYNLKHFERLGKTKNLVDICQKSNTSMNLASFAMSFFLKGKIEAYICAHGQLWDFAAFSLLTEEAGGTFSDFSGKKSLTSGDIILANKPIHDQVLNILNTK